MSYDTDKLTPGKQRIDVVQIDLGKCVNTYGVAPCAAALSAGSECVNSWQTCQDPANYDETGSVMTLSVCTPVSALPVGLGLIPCLDSVAFDSADITPDDGIGKVGSVTVKCSDIPHDDTGIDPYVSTRTYNPLTQGTLWPKMRARWPHYQGRALRWYTGYLHSGFSLSNLRMREYVIDSMSGFGLRAGVTIKAKDPLKLADDNRAQFPRKSSGTLTNAITDVATPTTIDITTDDATEYDLFPFESLSCVRMKDEVFQYTGTTIVTGGVRLTGVNRGAPSPYTCEQQAHDAGDDVQKCAYWDDMSPPNILRYLLTLGADVPTAYVDYTAWQTLYSFWLGSQNLTRLVCEPVGVSTQISEVLQQSNSWGLWWDDVAQEIGYEVFRPAALGETVLTLTDADTFAKVAVKVSDDNERLINEVVFWYGQVDPTKDLEETANYRAAVDYLDPESIDAKEVGSIRTRTIYGAWHAATPQTTVARICQRYITARSTVPFVLEFEVERKDDNLETGDFIDVETTGIRDMFGAIQSVRMRVVKADHGGDKVKYMARQDFVSERYGLFAPDALRGTTWATATAEQRKTYVFIANNDGFYSDGTPGKRIF